MENNKKSFELKQRSVKLSRLCIIVFAIALLVVDIFGYPLVNYVLDYAHTARSGTQGIVVLMFFLYSCSIPAYILLWHMKKLLENIENEKVFVDANVWHLQIVSYCCLVATFLCLVSSVLVWFSLIIVAVAAGFMGLIVHIIKNIFEQAIYMKDELDFTV